VIAGTTLSLLVVILALWVVALSDDQRQAQGTPAPGALPKATPITTPEPPKKENPPVKNRLPLKDLFKVLAPAVPVVKAVGVGTGSGFLIQHGGKYLVVTNRHVIENASRGVTVHFLHGDGKGTKETVVPATDTRVIAVHRTADLALVDVSAGADVIEPLRIKPVSLAPRDHSPDVGEHAFAIGHPGGAALGILKRALSDGIISAVGREADDATFIQTTVPVNPGNSGGPLFDDDGKVIGVPTFVIRKGANRDITLQGLNFALEIRYVHELLTDPTKCMTREQIAAVLGQILPQQKAQLAAALEPRLALYRQAGFRPMTEDDGQPLQKFLHLAAGKNQMLPLFLPGGKDHAVVAVGQGTDDIDLVVMSLREARPLAWDTDPDATPQVTFRTRQAGLHFVVVMNPTRKPALVGLAVLRK
jgi:S1-C subfamily serine protease